MGGAGLIASVLSLLTTSTIANDKTYEKCENPAYEGHPPKGKVLKWYCNQFLVFATRLHQSTRLPGAMHFLIINVYYKRKKIWIFC